jgi:hypothetical protein
MKTSAKWGVLAVLVAAGAVGFACGGGEEETGPAKMPSASASQETAPPASAPSASAAASSAAPVETTPPPPPAPPPLVVAAMKFSAPKVKAAEIKDDGSVTVAGKPWGKFVANELQDASGKTLASVGTDGVIKMEGATKTMKFNDKDEVEVEGGEKLMIGDDGVVKMLKADGKADKESGKAKFTGFKPTARRAATVFAIAMLMPAPKAAAPAASAKPAGKPAAKPAPKK